QPPQFSLGQAAVPCHGLAKILRAPPPKIAQDLAKQVNAVPHAYVAKVDAVNGYLNFHGKPEAYGEWLLPVIRDSSFLSRPLIPESKRERVLVEYSQPNTHKALHVGHLRNMVYGDAVCNLLAYLGHEVVRATFPGDLGAHIAKTIWYIQKHRAGQ